MMFIPPRLSLEETNPGLAACIQNLIDLIDEYEHLNNEINKATSNQFYSVLKQAHEDYSNVLREDLKRVEETLSRLRFRETNNSSLLLENLQLKAENAAFRENYTTLLLENLKLRADLDTTKECVELISKEEEGEKKKCSSSREVMQQIKENRDILASHVHTVSAMIEKYDKIIDEFPTFIDDFPNLRNEPELRMVAEMQKILLMKEQLGLHLAEVKLKERVRVCEIGFPRHSTKKSMKH